MGNKFLCRELVYSAKENTPSYGILYLLNRVARALSNFCPFRIVLLKHPFLYFGTRGLLATITLVTKHRTLFRAYMFKTLIYPSTFAGVTATLVINPNFIQTAVCLLYQYQNFFFPLHPILACVSVTTFFAALTYCKF